MATTTKPRSYRIDQLNTVISVIRNLLDPMGIDAISVDLRRGGQPRILVSANEAKWRRFIIDAGLGEVRRIHDTVTFASTCYANVDIDTNWTAEEESKNESEALAPR